MFTHGRVRGLNTRGKFFQQVYYGYIFGLPVYGYFAIAVVFVHIK